jgi:succinate dehydrogenase/fumarate reductase-like Fe-S protein
MSANFGSTAGTPDDGQNPSIDTYYVDRDGLRPMVLDALIWIKNTNRSDTDISGARAVRVCAVHVP